MNLPLFLFMMSVLFTFVAMSMQHRHKYKTTHTNRWGHPTRQQCKCGRHRVFEYRNDADKIIGMPWDKGMWVYSDGETSDYKVSD